MAINLLEHGYNEVNAAMPGEFSSLPAGGYVCKVFDALIAKTEKNNLQLVLYLDIAEGDFQGFCKTATDRAKHYNPEKKWVNSGIYRQTLFTNTKTIVSYFKGLLTCFEKSNPNLKLNPANFESSVLRGCLCGFVFGEVEWGYKGKSGIRVEPRFPRSVDDIREGKFTVPELKKLDNKSAPVNTAAKDDWGGTPIDPDDTPF